MMKNLLDLEAFAAHVEAATRRAGITVEKREGAWLYVRLHGQPQRCNLQPIYQAYQGAPQRLDDVVQTHLTVLKKMPPPPPPPTEKAAAESFLPLFQQAEWLKAATKPGAPPPLYRPFIPGLIVTYVFDTPTYRAYVNAEMAKPMLAGDATLET